MKKLIVIFMVIALMISTNLFAKKATDIKGSKDNPYISRFQGSWIIWQQVKNFDRYFVLSLKDNKVDKYEIDGKIIRTQYKATKKHSVFEIYKSYEQALKNAGYEILINLDEKNCSFNINDKLYSAVYHGLNALPLGVSFNFENYFSYFAAKKQIGNKNIYIIGFVVDGKEPIIMLDVIEAKAIGNNLVTVKKLNEKLESKGHLVLSGIYFNTGKAILTPKSDATLKNIANYLNAHKDKKFIIVGHTDNAGDFASNMTLSKNRAKAVMNALITKYGVKSGQLKAFGDGQTAPIASNSTEKGKARNRRVEIVEF